LAVGLAADSRFAPLAVLGRLADLLPAFNPYISRHVAGDIPVYSPWLQAGGPWLSLPAAVFLAYLVRSLRRWRGLPAAEKVLFYWNWNSVWLLALTGLVFHKHPHQWSLFLFPAPFLAVALTLRRLAKSQRPRWAGAGLLTAMLASSIAASSLFARFVAESGGVSWHMASLEVKLEVLSWIRAQGGRQKVFFAENPEVWGSGYGRLGWTAAAWEVPASPAPASAPERVFYIHEPLGLGYDPELFSLSARLSQAPPKEFRSVRVFSFDREVPIPGRDIALFHGALSVLPFLPMRGPAR